MGYGCGDDEPILPAPDAPTTSGPDAGVVAGTYSHYVTSELVTGPDPTAYAFDLDGDQNVDNQLGAILLILKPLGFDADMTLSTAVNAGTIVVLHSVKAASLTSGAATWQVYEEALSAPLSRRRDGRYSGARKPKGGDARRPI